MTLQMEFDFDGLIQLLAGHLYSERKVFIRELIQNAHDGIQRRAALDADFNAGIHGRIDVISSLTEEPYHIRFRDNGIGMTREDLESHLSSIGTSGTRVASQTEDVPDLIGQFGIGFLSGFVVASRVEVRTRHFQSASPDDGWLWQNEGSRDYTLEPVRLESPGTEVRVFLEDPADRGLIQDDAVADVIRHYADMVRVAIHLNLSETPINTRMMPWERTFASDEERSLEYMIYLERTVPDRVMEVIPIDIDQPYGEEGKRVRAQGLLYITRTLGLIGADVPRTIRLFQRRMFVCENTPEILPSWATFVNGILNTPDLRPNAARDNFIREDEAYGILRDQLGEAIIAHLEALSTNQPERLSALLSYHDLAIKMACDNNEAFFDGFSHLLEWKVNALSPAARLGQRDRKNLRSIVDGEYYLDNLDYAWVTLPRIVESLPGAEDGGSTRLACFTTRASANQYFEMADAAETTVVDASHWCESGLLKKWSQRHPQVSLIYIDRDDDPAVFKDLIAEDATVDELAREMSAQIQLTSGARLRVLAKRFEPDTLTAVLKSAERTEALDRANHIMSDPNITSDLRSMAEDLVRLSRMAERRLTINASNPLIRKVARLLGSESVSRDDKLELMLGIYNDAQLYNQEMMTPETARIFHEQFGKFMSKNADFILDLRKLEEREAAVLIAEGETAAENVERDHLVGFYITPFDETFSGVREGVRMAVEDTLGCVLMSADQVIHNEMIHENVRSHLTRSDFHIVDVTGSNPNVMLELGAVLNGNAPRLLIQREEGTEDIDLRLPTDIRSAIVLRYAADDTSVEICSKVAEQIERTEALRLMMDDPARERVLSSQTIEDRSGGLLVGREDVCRALQRQYPTTSAWGEAVPSDVAEILKENKTPEDIAEVLCKRIVEGV